MILIEIKIWTRNGKETDFLIIHGEEDKYEPDELEDMIDYQLEKDLPRHNSREYDYQIVKDPIIIEREIKNKVLNIENKIETLGHEKNLLLSYLK